MASNTDILLAGVLTVSDSCFAGDSSDRSGDTLAELILSSLHPSSVARSLVPDEQTAIYNQLFSWCDRDKLSLVITTGGTGLSPRDVTPEATRRVLDRELPHLSTLMLIEGLKHTSYAALSRQICGNRGCTLVLNFPGSSSAVKECFSAVLPVLRHSIHLLRDELHEVKKCHQPSSVTTLEITEFKQFPMISVEECLKHIQDQSIPSIDHTVPLECALNSIISQDVYAQYNIPSLPASIKDGYAIRSIDTSLTRGVIGSCLAGAKPELELHKDTVAYITTGAYLPEGADSIVMVENTEPVEGERVNLLSLPPKGEDIREPGTDMRKGELVLGRGTLVGPLEIGVLAAAAAREVSVFSLPKVAVFSTGDEIRDIRDATNTSEYTVIDTNRITLLALLRNDGYKVEDLGIVRDNPGELQSVIRTGLARCDVLLSSGGMSMGNRDFVKPCLEAIGCKIWFGKVKVKPGKPTCFATLNNNENRKYIFGLPGNPASAIVTYILFVRKCLAILSGRGGPCNPEVPVVTNQNIELGDRTEFKRVSLKWEGGRLVAFGTGGQQSSRILSMRGAQALMRIPAVDECNYDRIEKGSVLSAVLITPWINQ